MVSPFPRRSRILDGAISRTPVPDLRSALQDGLAEAYTIERELGRGGMATVYLAHDRKHDRSVAIKVIRPELSAELGAQRFLREIRIASHLQHPHILTLIDSGETVVSPRSSVVRQALTTDDSRLTTLLYYVMPFVDGDTLRQRLSCEGKLPAEDAVRILRDVLDALAYAHRHGIVHRDIKPENIMLTGRHALVMDFGIAKAASVAAAETTGDGTLTALGLAIGTPMYMAPEQAMGQEAVDARADLYALGVVAYEMLGGQPPFGGRTPQAVLAAHATQPPPPLEGLASDLDPALAAAVMRCLEKDPDQRWPSAEELLAQLDAFVTPSGTAAVGTPAQRRPARPRSRAGIAAGVLLLALAASALWLGPGRQARERRWARQEAIPRLLALSERGDWEAAYTLARRVDAVLPGDSLFNALRPRFARRVDIRTNPPGAKVWRKAYGAADSTWVLLGRTPLDSVLLALAGGGTWGNSNRLRIEAAGYRTLDLVGLRFPDSVIALDRDGAIPPEMVPVPGGELDVFYPGFEHVKPVKLGDYLVDRYETTNAEFKRFVEAGGYRRRELWDQPFMKDGRPVPWEQGIALMTDGTGRQGPATWEAGDYPAGTARQPVGGLSWYEAAAYAKFAGKALPTVAHWNHAASVYNSAEIVPLSNFSGQGPVAVGSRRGISAYGTYDMAGNVREWCLNASGRQRFILGGGWNDLPYQFTDAYTQAPFDRSPTNGVRLVRYLVSDSNLARAGEPLQRSSRDFLKEPPVPDPVFAVYRRMFEYDRTPLRARVVESVDEGDWVRELVRMDAAYAGDSLLVYLYLPKRGARPYPAVVYFPGSNAIRDRAPQNLQWRSIDFIIKSGRAVLYPVYKGTYQRSDSLYTDVQDTTNFYRDHVLMWAKDLRRGIDYLETRPDIAADHLAYYGVSWGGAMGAIMPAVEPRIKVSVLYVAGLDFEHARPEVDPVNFLPRNTVPTLMLNGRYDFFFPMETSQVPMFRLLGTPPDRKRYVVEDGSHFVPRTRLIQETLAWLDRWQPLGR
jgi:serine/threonine protein kinase/formylglycine-generating enzyme required for sulfatase activity/dienelactone hydrolase